MITERIALLVSTAVLVSSVGSAQSASIKRADGSVIEGQIKGRLLLQEASTPRLAVVDGSNVTKIDEKGVRLREGSVVIMAGMPLGSDPKVFGSVTAIEILRVVIPLAEKMEAVKEVDQAAGMSAVLQGQGEGAGVGTGAISGGRVYFTKSFRDVPEAYSLAGELVVQGGGLRLEPALAVVTSTGKLSVPIREILSGSPEAK